MDDLIEVNDEYVEVSSGGLWVRADHADAFIAALLSHTELAVKNTNKYEGPLNFSCRFKH